MQTRTVSFVAGLLGFGTMIALALADPAIREIPDPALTPGEVASTDVADVCGHAGGSYSQRHRLSQTPAVKREVLARYGVAWSDRGKVEDDHDVPLCLGGSDSVRNRWPQYRVGTTWTAGDKDRLEARACELVCRPPPGSMPLPLAEAQGWFLAPADWRVSYCREFPTDRRC